MPEIVKVKPKAEARRNDWAFPARWDVDYSCPKCGKWIRERDIACDKCGTFFDWSKTAHIRMNPEIVWE